jgi:DNA-binding response OmpR family regulator
VSRPKILLIEEGSELSASLKAGYEEAGFEVETAASAEDGLARVPAFAPSLVLLELSPASRAGQACLVALRQCSNAAVIFLVAPEERAAVADALWQGATDCLVKPFNIRELIARTHAILRRRTATSTVQPRDGTPLRTGFIQRPKINPLLQ